MSNEAELTLPIRVDDEADEVRRARRRDSETWAGWYDRHFETLYRYAYHRLGNREEAQDIAAHVFLRALLKIDGYSYTGRPVLAWLYTICRNLVADELRRSRTRDPRALPDLPQAGGPDDLIDSIQLRTALEALKPEQREVIVLRFFVSLSIRDVAQLLGKSEAAVHSLQVRAIANLRGRLRS
jgi:RNA polymerase sigma-70 factor (ECF subfamily)